MAVPGYCPGDYGAESLASGAPDGRWVTTNDSYFTSEGFEANHLLLRQKKDRRNAQLKLHYDPSAYDCQSPPESSSPQLAPVPAHNPALSASDPASPPADDVGAPVPAAAAPAPGVGGAQAKVKTKAKKDAAGRERVARPARAPRVRQHRLASPEALREGREAANSRFTRPFHPYGWKNTKPVVEEHFMKTYNAVPRKHMYRHAATRRSRSLTYLPEGDDVAPAPTGPPPSSAVPPAAAAPTAAAEAAAAQAAALAAQPASKEVVLLDGRVKLCLFKADSRETSERAARRVLGVPHDAPLRLVDKHGRAAVLSYDTVSDGEALSLAAAPVPSPVVKAYRDMPVAGKATHTPRKKLY
eukprot:Rhum_TRINITY_DN1379_c0_g1::Rhum_TRINITY_DN1379_c0_g1_i1::g.3953::m.3953